MPSISHQEAMRLSEIYTPESLPFRLAAFVPSTTPEQREARIDAWREALAEMTVANEDFEEAEG